jgi:hypothetical protein
LDVDEADEAGAEADEADEEAGADLDAGAADLEEAADDVDAAFEVDADDAAPPTTTIDEIFEIVEAETPAFDRSDTDA